MDDPNADLRESSDVDSGEREDTFFLPPDFPGADGLKAGDTITLRVVGKNSDGEVEVESSSGQTTEGKSDDWEHDLRSNASSMGLQTD